MIADSIKRQLGQLKYSKVTSEYGDIKTILVTFEGGYCKYECDIRKGKTMSHKYYDLDWAKLS